MSLSFLCFLDSPWEWPCEWERECRRSGDLELVRSVVVLVRLVALERLDTLREALRSSPAASPSPSAVQWRERVSDQAERCNSI